MAMTPLVFLLFLSRCLITPSTYGVEALVDHVPLSLSISTSSLAGWSREKCGNIVPSTHRQFDRSNVMAWKLASSLRGGNQVFKMANTREQKLIAVTFKKSCVLFAKIYNCLVKELGQLTPIQMVLFVTTFLLGIKFGQQGSSWKRYTTASDIPSRYFGPQARYIKGRIVSVTDGDTVRFLHTPTLFHRSQLKKSQKKSTTCLPIRLCTIDTPETAKFGKPGQPFGDEAKKFLQNLVEGKIIRAQLLQKDQYGRAVAQVFTARSLFSRLFSIFIKKRGVDELLLKAGLAEVYQGANAVYGVLGKKKYLEFESQAKRKKIGIWSLKNRESAAEYKARTK